MTRLMYDAVNPKNLPDGASLYAGYVDGHYANVEAIRRRFPHAKVVTITVLGGNTVADVVDCETGDATPAHAAEWAVRRIGQGAHPTIYMNASTWPAVRAEVARRGIAGKVSFWVASYDQHAEIPAGAVAKQYASDDRKDTSIVADYWPGVDPAPSHQSNTAKHYGWYQAVAGDDADKIAAKEQVGLAELRQLNPALIGQPVRVGDWWKVRSNAGAHP